MSAKQNTAKKLIDFLIANRGQRFSFADACSRAGVTANQSTRSALNRYGSTIADVAGLYLLFPCPENDWMVGIADHEEDWIDPQLHLRKIMRGLARREAQGTNEQRRQLVNFDPAPRALFESALDLEDDISRLITRRDRLISQAIALLP